MFLLGRLGVLYGGVSDIDCPCWDPDPNLTAYNVEYRFSREPGGAELTLVEQRVSGGENQEEDG